MKKFIKNNSEKNRQRFLVLLTSLGILLLVSGCTNNQTTTEENVKTDISFEQNEQNKKVIQNILQAEFNVPNPEYQALVDKLLEWTPDEDYESEEELNQAYIDSPEFKAVFDYSVAQYEPYFTKIGYETFVKKVAPMKYVNHDYDFTLSVSDVDILRLDSSDSVHAAIYEFTFKVDFALAGEENEQFDFKGRASFGEDGKIREFLYLDEFENGLFEKMSEANLP